MGCIEGLSMIGNIVPYGYHKSLKEGLSLYAITGI
jgi:hypothetical protein